MLVPHNIDPTNCLNQSMSNRKSSQSSQSSSPDEGNQKLLNVHVITIDNDKSLPRFCSLVEQIIDKPKLSQLMKIFRDGESACAMQGL